MSKKMSPDDPAYWMLFDGVESVPTVFKEGCYICEDPEFAQMGLPLCYACKFCGAHVAADDTVCEKGHNQEDEMQGFEITVAVPGSTRESSFDVEAAFTHMSNQIQKWILDRLLIQQDLSLRFRYSDEVKGSFTHLKVEVVEIPK